MKQVHTKYVCLFTLLCIIGVAIPSTAVITKDSSPQQNDLTVAYAFIVGKIKNPYYDNSYNFQVVNVTIIGIFWKDIANPYFHAYRLNESWIVRDAQYMGINHFRIIINQTEITHLCGILANGDILHKYTNQ